uniref:Uncharacterized protein n=1 Tax=Mus musculus TaxID=10090 RepID=Q6R5F2_MOUSE|nr:unknown [Mus musculus]
MYSYLSHTQRPLTYFLGCFALRRDVLHSLQAGLALLESTDHFDFPSQSTQDYRCIPLCLVLCVCVYIFALLFQLLYLKIPSYIIHRDLYLYDDM